MPQVNLKLCRVEYKRSYLRIAFTLASLVLGISMATPAFSMDRVVCKREGKELKLEGRIEVEAEDGGILLLTRDGILWPIPAEELVKTEKDDKEFKLHTKEELARSLTKTFAPGFRIHHTKHYVFCYNTSSAYAQWVGSLYERLYSGFFNYWQRRGIELHEPDAPLVAVIFDSQQTYAAYSQADLGNSAQNIIGYYSLLTNRVNMYDLTGTDAMEGGNAKNSAAKINAILSRPEAERTVATIVHEATHQLAFNSGLHVRLADIPFWVSEGLAIYFETPDLQSAKGWRSIGGVNRVNLLNFRQYMQTRTKDGFKSLIGDDTRFRDSKLASQAYAEAWTLSYYLNQRKSEAYVAYLKELSQSKPLVSETPEDRMALFRKHFGEDLSALEEDFLKFAQGLQ